MKLRGQQMDVDKYQITSFNCVKCDGRRFASTLLTDYKSTLGAIVNVLPPHPVHYWRAQGIVLAAVRQGTTWEYKTCPYQLSPSGITRAR